MTNLNILIIASDNIYSGVWGMNIAAHYRPGLRNCLCVTHCIYVIHCVSVTHFVLLECTKESVLYLEWDGFAGVMECWSNSLKSYPDLKAVLVCITVARVLILVYCICSALWNTIWDKNRIKSLQLSYCIPPVHCTTTSDIYALLVIYMHY